MNAVFVCVFILSSVTVMVRDVSAFLPALLEGAKSAFTLGMTLAAVYAVWLGFLQVAQDAGALRGLSRVVRPLTTKLFRTQNDSALEQIAVNLVANFLGMGGAATGAGISAMNLLGNESYARALFFTVNCAGVQLLPVTILSLRVQLGANAPYSIVFPVLISSLFALAVGIVGVRIAYRRFR